MMMMMMMMMRIRYRFQVKRCEAVSFSLKCSMIEIHMDNVFDLLSEHEVGAEESLGACVGTTEKKTGRQTFVNGRKALPIRPRWREPDICADERSKKKEAAAEEFTAGSRVVFELDSTQEEGTLAATDVADAKGRPAVRAENMATAPEFVAAPRDEEVRSANKTKRPLTRTKAPEMEVVGARKARIHVPLFLSLLLYLL